MLATHDPRLIEIGQALATSTGRAKETFEFQMLLGVRPEEQKRLVELGYKVRVYVPYGDEWYAYLMRRMAEKPSNLALFVKSLVSKS
jgi:proline dehydrogenase